MGEPILLTDTLDKMGSKIDPCGTPVGIGKVYRSTMTS